MNPRSELPAESVGTSRRLAPWIVFALVLAAGIALAFRYGGRVTPLLDGIR